MSVSSIKDIENPFERLPPQSLEAEQATLGSILADPDALLKVVEIVHAKDFYRNAHKLIYEVILELFNRSEPVDIVSVSELLKDKNQLEDVGGRSYINDLALAVATSENVSHYAQIIRDKSMLRSLIQAGTEIVYTAYEETDADAALDKAEQVVFKLAQQGVPDDLVAIKEILPQSYEQIEERFNNKGTLLGVASGFYDLDLMTSGFQKSDLIIVAALKNRMYVAHRTTAALGDFIYSLTDQGKKTAMLAKDYCAYEGAAPVPYDEYVQSVFAQSIRNEKPGIEALRNAYADIVLSEDMLNTLGPAINSGRGIFLYGEPGNGKSTIAERIRNCYQDDMFIPRTLWIEGEIVQLFDLQNHEPLPVDNDGKYDSRWVKIKRPTVMVGGELTLESLDIRYNPILKISEAPLQMKANGGTFLIDDFGRQRVDRKELLNRWIVPLEKRFDFLVLPNGKKIQVPFDELIIFSTNLNPKDLVDDAFLRRIPYKIEVENPSEELFRTVFKYQCDKYSIPYDESMVNYLIDTHYRNKRGFRVCHPRDVLDQIINSASYLGIEPRMTPQMLDLACKNYFSAMDVVRAG